MLNTPLLLQICIAIDILVILSFLTLSAISYYRARNTLKKIDTMLDCAINGTFKESHIDESMLSSLESKLAAYLSARESETQHTADEKNTIKELISDISHQTKTPIANILLYSELLSEQEQNLSSQGKHNLTALHAQTEKLSFLIASLVKMSRLETDVFTLCPSAAPIMPVLTEAVRQLAPEAAQKGLRIIMPQGVILPEKATPCGSALSSNSAPHNSALSADTAVFDAKWTQEALYNLLDNAVKYTKAGSITIEVTTYEMFLCVTITDTGIGIAEEEHARIFSRFYRSPQVHDQEGVGIGLYLAREIITRQGGYLKLTSAPGQGSSFAVYLPR